MYYYWIKPDGTSESQWIDKNIPMGELIPRLEPIKKPTEEEEAEIQKIIDEMETYWKGNPTTWKERTVSRQQHKQ